MGKGEKIGDLADLVGAELFGDPEIKVGAMAAFTEAKEGEISFLVRPGRDTGPCAASALVVPSRCPQFASAQLVVRNVPLAAAIIHNRLVVAPFAAKGVHPSVIIGSDCDISPEVGIAAGVVIGDRVKIAVRVKIGANSVIGDDCEIGEDTVIHAGVILYNRVSVGRRGIIHSGVVLGADGFGFVTDSTGNHVKRTHVGRVAIEDGVELGANSCVDRANLGTTRVRSGVKTDNYVQIGHNADVGENCLLVAQVALGGSVVIGRNCVFAGQVGVKDHVKVGDRVMAGGKTGIHCDQPDGAMISGMPAIPHRQWLKAAKVFAELPAMARRIRKLEERLAKYAGQEQPPPDDATE